MSGWWSAASASSATKSTKRTAAGKVGNRYSREIEGASKSGAQPPSSPARRLDLVCRHRHRRHLRCATLAAAASLGPQRHGSRPPAVPDSGGSASRQLAPQWYCRRPMKFGIFLRAPVAQALGTGLRAPTAPELAGTDRTRGPARVRLRLGGGAPLPGGVLAQFRARGVPGRGVAADTEHPSRPRHRPVDDESPGASGGTGFDPRSGVERSGRTRPRRGLQRHRVASLRPQFSRQADRVGGGRPGLSADVLGRGLGVPRPLLRLPAAQRDPEAAAAAPPAALGRLLAARHDPLRRPPGDGRAVLQSSSISTPPAPGSTRTTTPSSAISRSSATTGRIRTWPPSAASCARPPTRRRGRRRTAGPSSSSPSSFTTRRGRSSPGRTTSGSATRSGKQTPEGRRRSDSELIGSPETIRERLRELERAHVDQSSCSIRPARTPTRTS